MKTVLITGSAGFLGSHLCDKMLSCGFKVIGIDNLCSGNERNISHLNADKNFTFIKEDVISFDTGEKIDYILNFACPASPVAYQRDPLFTSDTCYLGARNMLEMAKRNNAVILQASTSEVYGDPDVSPQNENYCGNVNPHGIRSCYDEGKRIAESLMFDYARLFGVKIKVARIFNTYGPRMDKNDGRVVSNFIVQALQNKPITVYGRGEQTRSFCYVDDLVDGITKLLLSKDDIIGPINIGTDFEFSISWLANTVTELIKTSSEIEYKSLPSDDPQKRRPDLTLAKQTLGYMPKVSVLDGLAKTIEYFRQIV
ncbi:MAG: SDR family oxidoreductase [Endomicrobium sp.]|jgi:UDP-glucuronate decarboxylase|nr:SDR family oxidoreductase [Endomicrobium sp.]